VKVCVTLLNVDCHVTVYIILIIFTVNMKVIVTLIMPASKMQITT
jgi:hypothetical protein